MSNPWKERYAGCETDAEMDALDMGDIRSDIEKGDWKGAWSMVEDLSSDELRETMQREITRRFELVTCPACGGKGGWSGRDWRGADVDADCPFCDCLGLASPKEVKAYERETTYHYDDPYFYMP